MRVLEIIVQKAATLALIPAASTATFGTRRIP
jgi:hypothetical protein